MEPRRKPEPDASVNDTSFDANESTIDTRRPWVSPTVRVLPVASNTLTGPQKKPKEKLFYIS